MSPFKQSNTEGEKPLDQNLFNLYRNNLLAMATGPLTIPNPEISDDKPNFVNYQEPKPIMYLKTIEVSPVAARPPKKTAGGLGSDYSKPQK